MGASASDAKGGITQKCPLRTTVSTSPSSGASGRLLPVMRDRGVGSLDPGRASATQREVNSEEGEGGLPTGPARSPSARSRGQPARVGAAGRSDRYAGRGSATA